MCALDVSSEQIFPLTDFSAGPTLEANLSSPALSVITEYMITHRQASESAWIFFINDNATCKPMVAKVLRPYFDLRYDLSDATKRQRCQLEAFQHNRIFTPEAYIGLAKLHHQPTGEDRIVLGGINQHPSLETLEPGAEYALIMERLPDNFRLDQLLEGDESTVEYLLDALTSHIAHLQKNQTLSLTEKECANWGSYLTLQNKLEENLAFLSLVLNEVNSPSLKETIERLCTGLREIFTVEHYTHYFEERVHAGFIKHCHGDIKSLNIWIMPGDQLQKNSIKLLDAIDFNPLFNNIDILSDFAMLVIDVWARTSSAQLACRMIDYYLRLTDQDTIAARIIFEYYLIEKAIVASAINILFDNQFELGLRLLDLAQERLNHLSDCMLYQPA